MFAARGAATRRRPRKDAGAQCGPYLVSMYPSFVLQWGQIHPIGRVIEIVSKPYWMEEHQDHYARQCDC